MAGAQIPLTAAEVTALDLHFRAANYLAAGQIYLMANPLLREPLTADEVKPRLLGHWGTAPGLNFIHAHLNRIIRLRGAEVLLVCGPGHGAAALLANAWIEGSYSTIYPEIGRDAAGMGELFRRFSFPGGVSSHAGPETPGSIHEGGELGYALAHAQGAAFDDPELVVACVVGDGEAETGPLAASWQGMRFLNPARDGAVLPILHLNGYKIANPTVMGRMTDASLDQFFRGLGYEPIFVAGADLPGMHHRMAAALDRAFERIAEIRGRAREGETDLPSSPMVVLRSPKGWTGPAEVDGRKVEDFWRAHQIPIANARADGAHRRLLETWMRGYRPEDLFDAAGAPVAAILDALPPPQLRIGMSPRANAGVRAPLRRADWRAHAVAAPGGMAEATRLAGGYLAEAMRLNAREGNFRVVGPDETASNRLDALFGVTSRVWTERTEPYDEALSRDGRVVEVLSEHLCEGWLEGYTLTGRHGVFNCYEAFAHIVNSMVSQHAKWLQVARALEWRRPVPSLNILLTSHVWRQDHNGFSHQDPGFIDLLSNKSADVVRIYLPPDANCLLRTMDHCLTTYDRVNVIVAGKQPAPQWLPAEDAERHCAAGLGIWSWAGTEIPGREPDVVLACAGDVPTMETIAAAELLRHHVPGLAVRVVNVVDLLCLQPSARHPHGISDADFDAIFTTDRPVIFAFHGYPHLVHRLTYRRANHDNLHVHGFSETGRTTTPFDMAVMNRIDRFHLAIAAIDRVPGLAARAALAKQRFRDQLSDHDRYVRAEGDDLPEIRNWTPRTTGFTPSALQAERRRLPDYA